VPTSKRALGVPISVAVGEAIAVGCIDDAAADVNPLVEDPRARREIRRSEEQCS
jgi:hypothetical protein